MTNTKQKPKRRGSGSTESPVETKRLAKRLIGKPFKWYIEGTSSGINENGTLFSNDVITYTTKPNVASFTVVSMPNGSLWLKVPDGKVPGGMVKIPDRIAKAKLFS
tara:strand:- start:416 stop:733 length:318 start_codon:yes stop_codon:yes gene_type:complete